MREREGFNVKCRFCGKEFYVRPYFLRKGWGKYCSKKCKDESQKTGKYVVCSYCGKRVYRSQATLRRESKTKTYFCNKSCQCAWKNVRRKKKEIVKLWRPWGNSSPTGCGPVGTDANSVGLPFLSFFKFLKPRKKKLRPSFFRRPSKKVLFDLYWKKNYLQIKIAEVFNVAHTTVKRWLNYYRIPIKPRTLTCGRNPDSLKCLELGRTPEVIRKSAQARRIYTKEKLIQKIKEFVEEHGRIPSKNEFIKHLSSYPNHTTYRDYFGTWSNAIKEAGYKPNERWFCSRDLYAQDGHLCKSISEIIIDDWLSKNNIPHEREKLYPEGKYRCDFVVRDIFIEFFGLINTSDINPHYKEIVRKKREMCRRYGIFLIELCEKDLYNLDLTLGEKLKTACYSKF